MAQQSRQKTYIYGHPLNSSSKNQASVSDIQRSDHTDARTASLEGDIAA
jgi:hypothetical protein